MTETTLRHTATGLYGIAKPAPLTGRPYVGFFASGSELQAWQYRGGTYERLLATIDKGDEESVGSFAIVNLHAPLVVVFQATGGAVEKLYVWNVTTNGLAVINRTPGTLHASVDYQVGHPLRSHEGHGFFYWVEYESELHRFWLMRGGMGGGVEQLTEEADGQLDNPTEFVNDFGGFLSREDGAIFIPNWGGGTPAQSGYIHLPLNGDAPSRVADTTWLPDITVGVQEWEDGQGTAAGAALLMFDGAGFDRRIYKWTLEGGLVTIVGAAHNLGNLTAVRNYHESLGGEVILFANDAGTRKVARVSGGGIADPPTETIAWTPVGVGPNGNHPLWLVAQD